MKAVSINTPEEFDLHRSSGHETEYTYNKNQSIHMPRSDQYGSGGWIQVTEWSLGQGHHRAFVPDDWCGFEEEKPEYLDEELVATAEHEFIHASLIDELAEVACRHGIRIEYNIDTGLVTLHG